MQRTRFYIERKKRRNYIPMLAALVWFAANVSPAQIRVSGFGVTAGAANIAGLTAGAYGSAHLETEWAKAKGIPFRLFAVYMRDAKAFFPADGSGYTYPTIFGVGLSAHAPIAISKMLGIDIGAGGAWVRDGVYNFIEFNELNYASRIAMLMNAALVFRAGRMFGGKCSITLGAEHLLCIPFGFTYYTALRAGVAVSVE